ncbi:MAG TPA: hypothetical protein VN253_02350, partial [Kofleriaceae bacterium]|nr:hypothetical protein [Kofleriaceae bacterium]
MACAGLPRIFAGNSSGRGARLTTLPGPRAAMACAGLPRIFAGNSSGRGGGGAGCNAPLG